jgi:hypothetical protein
MNVLERIKQQVQSLTKSVRIDYGDDAQALSMVKEAARRVGIMPPDDIEPVNTTEIEPDKYDSDAAILLSGLNCAINDLISQNLWWECFEELRDFSWQIKDIDTFELPEDFGGFVSSGFVGLYIPRDVPYEQITESDFIFVEFREGSYDNYIKCETIAYTLTSIKSENPNIVNRFVVYNGRVNFVPGLDPLKYQRVMCLGIYRSVYGVVSSTTGLSTKYFKYNKDVSKLDPELLVRGAVVYYAQTMGLDTSMHMQRYAQYLQACQQNRANRTKIVDSSLSYNALTNRGRYG